MRFEGNRSGGFGGRRFGGGGRRFGGGFRRGGFDEPKPVKVGEEYEVDISETGSRGDGIARVNNFVVFVNGAKQGEKIKIRITDVKDRFAIGQKADEAAAVEQPVEGTDDMSEASDVTEESVSSAEDDLDESDEPSDENPESEDEEKD